MGPAFGLIAVAMIAASIASGAAAQPDKELVVAEPVHSFGYLPLYVAVHKDGGCPPTLMG